MINLQTQFELEISARQWVDSVMSQYNIAATDMENALTKVILDLKQQVLQDYLTEQQEAYQKAKMANDQSQKIEEN